MSKYSLLIFLLIACSGQTVRAHPSVSGNEHPHTTSNIFWEADSVKDGNVAHNHYDNKSFNGAELFTQPSGAGACWDNTQVRVDAIGTFLKGHCYVNEFAINTTPTYYLSSAIPSAAKDRIRDAFDEYSFIELLDPSFQVGAAIAETSISAGADIIVQWTTMPAINHGGETVLSENGQSYLRFDSAKDWSYQRGTSNVSSEKWHFYSVVLHEVGHAFGLGHQPAGDINDVMNAPVGEPLDDNGRHFGFIDDDSVFGIVRLYTRPIPSPPEPECTADFFACNESDDPMVFVSFDEPLGYSAVSFTADKLLSNGSWSPIGGLSNPGCIANAASLGWNTYRVILNTLNGSSSCQVVYFGDLEDCNANLEW